MVHDGEWWSSQALRVLRRVHLREHVDGLAHPVHIKSSETLFLLIGGLHHRQLFNGFDDVVDLGGELGP